MEWARAHFLFFRDLFAGGTTQPGSGLSMRSETH
jgi:hypothetical protein